MYTVYAIFIENNATKESTHSKSDRTSFKKYINSVFSITIPERKTNIINNEFFKILKVKYYNIKCMILVLVLTPAFWIMDLRSDSKMTTVISRILNGLEGPSNLITSIFKNSSSSYFAEIN